MIKKIVLVLVVLVSFAIVNVSNVDAQACSCGSVTYGACGAAGGCPTGSRRAFTCIDDTPCNPSNPSCIPLCETWQPSASCQPAAECQVCSPGSQVDRGCGAGHCWPGYRYIDICRADGSGYDFLECRFSASCPNVCGNNICEAGAGENCSSCSQDCGSCCTTTAPVAPVNAFPTNNQIIETSSVSLQWNQNGSWGQGCPANNNRYRVQIQQNCTGAFTTYGTWLPATQTNLNVTGLNYGQNYCWRVEKNNGSSFAYSPVTSFSLVQSPVISSAEITLYRNSATDVCGTGYSGSASMPNTSNPLTFSLTGTDVGNTRNLVVALLPTTGAYAENGNLVDFDTARSKAINANSVIAAFNLETNSIYTTGSSNSWVSFGSGDVTTNQNTATILNIGTDTNGTKSGNNFSGNIRIRFEDNFPLGNYNIYVMADKELGDGSLISNDATVALSRVMRRIGSWNIDTISPSVSVSEPEFQTNTTEFDINYSLSDTGSGVSNRRLLISSSDVQGRIFESGFATYNFAQQDVLEFKRNLTNNSGVLSFEDLEPGLRATYGFSVEVSDIACNTVSSQTAAAAPFPWILTTDAPISANGGFNNLKTPNQRVNIPEIGYDGLAYMTTSIGISGTGAYPTDRASSLNANIRNYLNTGINLPAQALQADWYNYLLTKAQKSSAANIQQLTLSNLGSRMSSSLSVQQDSLNTFIISPQTGNTFNIDAGTICDIKGIFFIQGDLNIEPDLLKSNSNNACIFITTGNVNIGNGSELSSSLKGSDDLASYDKIEAMFIANGTVNAPIDSRVYSKNDGLYITGSIVSNSINIGRDIGGIDNRLQPSIIIEFDPAHRVAFKDIFNVRFYSIREE